MVMKAGGRQADGWRLLAVCRSQQDASGVRMRRVGKREPLGGKGSRGERRQGMLEAKKQIRKAKMR